MRMIVNKWTHRIGGARRVIGDGVRRLVEHERWALYGHSQEVLERMVVARQARNLPELIHDQLDLFPESRRRFARNHQMRRRIIATMKSSLSETLRAPA
jgi:hypothetical protein